MYNLQGNDNDFRLFDLQVQLKRVLKERVEVRKLNDHIQIVIAYNWSMSIPFEDMDDLLDDVGEPDSILRDTFNKYKERTMVRKP